MLLINSLPPFIQGGNGLPDQPALEFALGHSTQCLRLMSQHGLGSAAFASVSELLGTPLHPNNKSTQK